MSLSDLHVLCRRRGFRLALELVDPTGHTVGAVEGGDAASLRVRVFDRDGEVLAGRIQSTPGLERVDELALGTLDVLRKRGLVVE